MPQGSFGTVTAYNDFLGSFEDVTWASTSVDLNCGWFMVSVNEGTLQKVVDEDGGILQFLTDGGDDDNVCLLSGPYRPSNGPLTLEARFKIANDIASAIYVGFTETMALGTPLMPAEFDTATMTYNGSGGMVGLQWDSDGTTDAWRALAGDGGAVANSDNYGANGTTATDAVVADEFDIVKVVLYPSGRAEVWHDEELVASGQTDLTATDQFYACIMCENRTGTALQFEVDYVFAEGVRDWTV
jgi:hypothetical protein